MTELSTIAFDADDTLWHNERFFQLTRSRFAALVAESAPADHLAERIMAAEHRNLGRYGFGVKGFVLSLIEVALEVTENRLPGQVVRDLIDAGHEMLAHPVELLPSARETLTALSGRFRLVLITKGDLLDQERKLAQSGLGDLFDSVEIVADKTADMYAERLGRHPGGAAHAMMIGNSIRSDVLPALGAGAWGVHVPHAQTWSHEHADAPYGHPRFREVRDLGQIPPLVASLTRRS